MHQPNIHEVRENLAEYLAAAERGEEVLICRRNQPVARLVAVARQTGKPRPIGRAADAGTPLPASFWEPLPEALVDALAGHEPAGPPQGRNPERAARRLPDEPAGPPRGRSPERAARSLPEAPGVAERPAPRARAQPRAVRTAKATGPR